MKDKKPEIQIITTHHEARRDYEILETMEAGIMLQGCEVKSLRGGKCSLAGSFAHFDKTSLFLRNLYIPPYIQGNRENPEDPMRERKLLLHKAQLERIHARVKEKGLTLVPLKIYFNATGIAKVDLALAKGKNLYDKRVDIKKSAVKREIDRAIKNRNNR